jgi:hypothetical protein
MVFSSLVLMSSLNAFTTKDSALGGDIGQEMHNETIFVSLGSMCETAHMHRDCGIRKAAFPFDWIVSFNGEKVIEILEEDFFHFLDFDVLRVSGQSLLNDYYCLEFLNEGDWEDANYNVEAFIEKCQRRIDRFRLLGDYHGKVFFVRTSYPESLTNAQRVWKIKENIEISYEYAEKLHHALKVYFPSLNFRLIVMNTSDVPGYSIEEQQDHLLMVKIHRDLILYQDFYSKLLLGTFD